MAQGTVSCFWKAPTGWHWLPWDI